MHLRFIYTLVIVFITTQIGVAQIKISGKVIDQQTQETLTGVTIYLNDLKTGASTDAMGHYQIEDLNPGNHLLEISFVGYNKEVERIYFSTDTTLNFELKQAVSELNEVVVTAVTRSTELKSSPVIIKPIDIGLLNQTSSANLIDALKNIPGINQITTGAGISKPTIRGLGYNRVIALYNGIRQEGQQWGDEHGVEIDEYAIGRIEIVKGPGSLMYGSDGIAGVLNFISPNAPLPGQIKTQLISNYQSNNGLIGNSISNTGNKNGLQWLARLSTKFAGNYKNGFDGQVYNSGFQEYDGSIFLGLNKKWGYTHLHLNSFNTKLNMVEGERDEFGNFLVQKSGPFDESIEVPATDVDLSGYQIGYPHQEVNHLRALSNSYFILGGGSINLDLAYQNNKRKEFGDVQNPDIIDLFFDLNTFNYNLRYNLPDLKDWETSIGVNGMQQQNINRGEEFLIPEYHLLDIGAFVFAQKNMTENLTFAAGLRFDNRSIRTQQLLLNTDEEPTEAADNTAEVKFPAISRNFNNFSGSIGLAYQLSSQSTIKFNLSRGLRTPNIAEIASNGQHEGSFRYEYGSTNLSAEISHQIDLAYFLNTEHVTFELTPFANFISNYIYSGKLTSYLGGDSIPDASDPSPAFKFKQGNASLYGGELFLDIHPHPFDWLHLEQSFSFVRAVQASQPDSTRNLSFTPAPKYRAVAKAQFKQVGKYFSNVYLQFAIDHTFAQNNIYRAYNTETATPAYTLLSAGVGTRVKAYDRADFLNIFVSFENLTDLAYQSHLSRLKYAPENPATGRLGVYNMGRNISLKMILNF